MRQRILEVLNEFIETLFSPCTLNHIIFNTFGQHDKHVDDTLERDHFILAGGRFEQYVFQAREVT